MSTQNKDLTALIKTLENRSAAKRDFVAPAHRLVLEDGSDGLEIKFHIPQVEDVFFQMSNLFQIQLAEKLEIPLPYFRKLKEKAPALLVKTVNFWLGYYHNKTFLIRSYVGEETTVNMARAFLSDSYSIIDDLRVMETVKKSIQNSSASVYVDNWDLTENRLYLSVLSGEIENGVAGGFIISNSETGQGAFEIRPRAVILETGKSITIDNKAFRKIHLGGKLKAGEVLGQDEVKYKVLENQISQAIKDFLNPNYLKVVSAVYEELKKTPLKYPIDALQNVFKQFSIPEPIRLEILTNYMQVLNKTAGDIFNSVILSTDRLEADDRYNVEGNLVSYLLKTKNYDKPY